MKTSTTNPPANRPRAALLIIDVQQGLFSKPTPIYRAEELLNNINTLVECAHRAGAPVFYVQHADKKTLVKGTEEWQLHPQLHPLDKDRLIPKSHVNAFQDTVLAKELDAKGIEWVVVTGLVTYACVRATCLGAKKLGYGVVLVSDTHSNYSKNATRVIAEWNRKLSAGTVELKAAAEIEFD